MIRSKKIIYLFFLSALFAFMKCSPTRMHKTLTFFIDGVPDSAAVAAKRADRNRSTARAFKTDSLFTRIIAESKYNLHKPYKEHQCEKCHDINNMGHFVKPLTQLCITCHESYDKKFAYVHGPVTGGYCSECHNAHMSENKNLLTRVNENVCYSCHAKTDILENKKHQGVNTSGCIGCHNPHGGKNHYMEN